MKSVKIDIHMPPIPKFIIHRNGCELTKNGLQTIFEPLLELNKAKRLRQNDVSRKREPSVFQNSSTFHGHPKCGVTKSYGACDAENHSKT